MIGNLYNWVLTELVGQVPIEFEFIIAIIVIFVVVLILYVTFSGFILLKDLFRR